MELKHIEVFLAIVEQRSITKAAESLYLSQPTVSNRLSALERELDTLLIERGKGIATVSLTPKGRAFVPIAQRWLSLYMDTTAFKTTDIVYPLRIAGTDSLNAYMLYPLYNAISDNEKKIFLSVRTSRSHEIYDFLEQREIDVGFTYQPLSSNNFRTEPLFEREVVLVERSVKTRENPVVEPAVLDPTLEVDVAFSSLLHNWHDNYFDPEAIPYIRVDSPLMVRNTMSKEGCWCMVPKPVANFMVQDERLHMYQLVDPPPNVVCYMATHRFPKPSTVNALKILDKYLYLMRD